MKRVSYKDVGLRYMLDPFEEPVLRIKAGEEFAVEVQDAASGQIRRSEDLRDLDSIPFGNPVVGPIYVEGVKRGDALIVKIVDVKPTIGQGTTYLSSFSQEYLMGAPFCKLTDAGIPSKTKICRIEGDKVHFSEGIALPYRPMVGTLATAPMPEVQNMSSAKAVGCYGGNMDIPEMGPSAEVYLPVFHRGGLLYVGDAHALQGDGEISGTGVEMPAEVVLTVDVARAAEVRWPRIRLGSEIMFVAATGPGRSLEDAVKTAFLELVLWMEKYHGMDRYEALMLCSLVARVRLGNLWTVIAKIDTKYLPPKP